MYASTAARVGGMGASGGAAARHTAGARFGAADSRGTAGWLGAHEPWRPFARLAEFAQFAVPFLQGSQQESRSECGHDDVRHIKSKLFPRLKEECLRAFRVIRPKV